MESIIKNMSAFGIPSLILSEDPLLCLQTVRKMIVTFTEELQTV